MLKVFIFYDISENQVNGVKSSYDEISNYYSSDDKFSVNVIGPEKLKFLFKFCISKAEEIYNYCFIKNCSIDYYLKKDKNIFVHIATEGSVGRAVKNYCEKHGINYTTSYHTMFPEYVYERVPFFKKKLKQIMYAYLKSFHKNSKCILTPSDDLKDLLISKGFNNVQTWLPGVDFNDFYKIKNFNKNNFLNNNELYFFDNGNINLLYVGRVTPEKNIYELLQFVKNNNGYNLIVVGHGNMVDEYQNLNIENVFFVGKKSKQELINFYNFCDCFVFPSKTDTFGIVLLEALVCGINVATFKGQSGAISINKKIKKNVVIELNNLGELCNVDLKNNNNKNIDFSCFSKANSYKYFIEKLNDYL